MRGSLENILTINQPTTACISIACVVSKPSFMLLLNVIMKICFHFNFESYFKIITILKIFFFNAIAP